MMLPEKSAFQLTHDVSRDCCHVRAAPTKPPARCVILRQLALRVLFLRGGLLARFQVAHDQHVVVRRQLLAPEQHVEAEELAKWQARGGRERGEDDLQERRELVKREEIEPGGRMKGMLF
jgi:hypothetical protein